MPFVLIRNVEVVGMHHWGSKQLTLSETYRLYAEPNNTEDVNAVAVYEIKPPVIKRAYLTREWAKMIQPALSYAIYATVKVQEPAVVIVYDKGPQHNCLMLLKCTDTNRAHMENYFHGVNIACTIKDIL